MFCGNCGVENPPEHNFCSACGKPLQSAMPTTSQNGRYSVILQSVPQDEFERFRLSKQLAELLNITEQEISGKIANAPSIVASVGSLAEGEEVQQRLQGFGVEVRLRPEGKENLTSGNGSGTHTQKSPINIDKLDMNLLAHSAVDTNRVVPQVQEKTAQAVGGLVLLGFIFFCFWLARGCGNISGGGSPPTTKQDYARKMASIMSELSSINKEVVQSSTALSNGTGDTDSASAAFEHCQRRFASFSQELEGITPPSGFGSVHESILQGLGKSAEACRLFQLGLETKDPSLYDSATSYQVEANRLLERAISEFPE